MRFFDLVNIASRYFKIGIAAALSVGLCVLLGYFVVYRKIFKGQRKIRWKRFLWWGIFICYLCVVLGATLFSRSEIWSGGRIEPLFYSYKDAWIDGSKLAWRNIILNFCMFVPLGFWLPLGMKKLRRFWKTYLSGFAFSLLIECTQLFLRRGIFELDDIMGNTAGTMIGYGLFAIGAFFAVRREGSKRESSKRDSKREGCRKAGRGNENGSAERCRAEGFLKNAVLLGLLQLPLILTVAVFAVIFWKYDRQELGNHPYQYVEAYDSARIHMTGERSFCTEERELQVYEVGILTTEAAKEKGERIFAALGTSADDSRTDIYDETIVMYSEAGSYHLWIDYQGGTLWLTSVDVLFSEDHARSEPVTGADESEIRDALRTMGFELPKDAVFRELGFGTYQFDAVMSETEQGIVNGTFICDYYGKGKGIGELSDQLITCTPYKSYGAISQQEAYDRIAKGEFKAYRGTEHLEIQVGACSLVYVVDSKGYYQPGYRFECMINGEESQIVIPALKEGGF